jgi:hypothetical protein
MSRACESIKTHAEVERAALIGGSQSYGQEQNQAPLHFEPLQPSRIGFKNKKKSRENRENGR